MITVLAVLDIIGGVVMLWSMQRITTRAGFNGPDERWAFLRRSIYAIISVSLFGLGVERLAYPRDIPLAELCFQIFILMYIIVFPILRALGLITQDRLTLLNGIGHPPDAR